MQYDPTDAQEKAFAESEADFRQLGDHMGRIRESARTRLTVSGWGGPDPGDTVPCLSCPCPDFQAGGPLGQCRRGGCHHPISDHDLPT
ncbi:hypothetical protein QA802_39900 [Streptomyces sp. B21-105]|uniref:hypothetical protein n=1 Tax=Streptomyces sp. B21-105 TaxID=3039417 RepID=UPI002FF33730